MSIVEAACPKCHKRFGIEFAAGEESKGMSAACDHCGVTKQISVFQKELARQQSKRLAPACGQFVFACVGCSEQFRVSSEQEGKKVRCPKCSTSNLIPMGSFQREQKEEQKVEQKEEQMVTPIGDLARQKIRISFQIPRLYLGLALFSAFLYILGVLVSSYGCTAIYSSITDDGLEQVFTGLQIGVGLMILVGGLVIVGCGFCVSAFRDLVISSR